MYNIYITITIYICHFLDVQAQAFILIFTITITITIRCIASSYMHDNFSAACTLNVTSYSYIVTIIASFNVLLYS